jgi:hypothetical protein
MRRGRERGHRLAFAAIVAPATTLALLAAPTPAFAHAEGAVPYQFPVPLWLYVLGGAIAVAASVPAAVLADERIGAGLGRNRYRPGTGWLVLAVRVFMVALLVEMLVAGLFGSQEFASNPMTILIWVDFWVGLGLVSALFGPVWHLVDPIGWAGRGLDRLSPEPPLVYPMWLGQWPAVAELLVFAWLELAWPGGSTPRDLAVLTLLYLLLQVVAMALFGGQVWLHRGELFTVFSHTMARVSPLEWYVEETAVCPAGLHAPGDSIGCSACWLAAPPEARGIRWRGFTSGAWRERTPQPGSGLFIVLLLAVVLYDGFSETMRFTDIAQWLFHHGLAPQSDTALRTLIMAIVMLPLVAVFALVAFLLGHRRMGFADAVERYAPTLMPIVAVYFAAHYLLYFLSYGQLTWKVILDPFETDWVPDLGIWTGYPHSLPWSFQVTVIVLGHIAAIFAAHRIALAASGRRRDAVSAQIPLIALMIGYTVLGLWILGQAYTGA